MSGLRSNQLTLRIERGLEFFTDVVALWIHLKFAVLSTGLTGYRDAAEQIPLSELKRLSIGRPRGSCYQAPDPTP